MSANKPFFVDVVPFKRLPHAASVFTYRVDDKDIAASITVGSIVKVPFRNGQIFGVVTARTETSAWKQIKPVSALMESSPSWTREHIKTVQILAKWYNVPLSLLFFTFAPHLLTRAAKEKHPPADTLQISPPPVLIKPIPTGFETDKKDRSAILQVFSLSQKISAYRELIRSSQGSVLIITPQFIDALELANLLHDSEKRCILWKGHDQSKSAQTRIWEEMKQGNQVIIGTRSALFAPLPDLATIVVDQEEKPEHKQWDALPFLDNRIAARLLAEQLKAKLFFVAYAPRVETAAGRRFNRLSPALPPLSIVYHESSKPLLHPSIEELLETVQEKGSSAAIVVSHKGLGRTLHCLNCRHQWYCDGCAKTLQVYADKLRCPQCEKEFPLPVVCPQCGGPRILPFGAGIQGVMTALAPFSWKLIPITSGLLEKADTHAQGIYITTPGLLKKLYYAGVKNLSDVILFNPENQLFAPDYRASEQFLTTIQQAAIEAHDYFQARVTVQTRLPEHSPLVEQIISRDYPSFLVKELAARKSFGFPPFRHASRLILRDPKHAELPEVKKITSVLQELSNEGISFIGPSEELDKQGKKSLRWDLLTPKILSSYNLDKSLKSVYSRLIIDLTPFA